MRIQRLVALSIALVAVVAACKKTDTASDSTATTGVPAATSAPTTDSTATTGVPAATATPTDTTKKDSTATKKP